MMDKIDADFMEAEEKGASFTPEEIEQSFSAEEMQNMKMVGTCKVCQGMHSAGGEVCDRCAAFPAGTMCVFTAEAVEMDDAGGKQIVLQGLGVALVAKAGVFPFNEGDIFRVIVQGET